MNKSPFNYIGNKYQILKQLLLIFPTDINTLVDYFCGGCDISTNINAKNKIAIDINTYLMDILNEFQKYSLEEIITFMENRIQEFQLSKTNEDGYLKYREAYNENPQYHTPLDLFTLSRFSFHFTMRFNSSLKMNAGFGRGYSNFSERQRKSINQFHKDIQPVKLVTADFKTISLDDFTPNDFLYFDPPYLITNNVYNHGLQQVNQKWDEWDERALLKYLDEVNTRKLRFALSNVLSHRGKTNEILKEWIEINHFNVHPIETSYSHCTHTVNQNDAPSVEVVITNY